MKKHLIRSFILILLAPALLGAATQTINTLPAQNSAFVSTLQSFLRDELPARFRLQYSGFIISGGIGATSANLTHTVSAAIALPGGYYVSQDSVSHTYTASRTTFVYLDYDNARTVSIANAVVARVGHFLFVTMNAGITAEPAAPTWALRLMKVTTGAAAITSVVDLRDLYTAPYNLITTEAELIAALADSTIQTIIIDTSFALTASQTLTKPVYIANGAVVTCTGFVWTETKPHLSTGAYQQFVAASGEVVFAAGTVEYALPDWFGANTTPGTTDMSAEISAAAAATDTVRFLNATYIVTPANVSEIITSNTHFVGDSGATIKVADSVGDFQTIFGSITGDQVTNVTFENLIFDLNTSNGGTVATGTGYAEDALCFNNIVGLTVKNCKFYYHGVHAVTVSGVNCENINITDNYFEFLPKTSPVSYDNNGVYVEAAYYTIADNVFKAAIGTYSRSGIELHGTGGNATGNTITGYQTGINVVSAHDLTPTYIGHVVSANTMVDVCSGVRLWPITGKTMRDIAITGNTIGISQSTFKAEYDFYLCMGIGVAYSSGSTGTIEGLTITGNTITFEVEATPWNPDTDYLFGGIVLTNYDGIVTNAAITGNTIIRAPVTGILTCDPVAGHTNAALRDSIIAHNIIVDAGQNSSALAEYRNAVTIIGTNVNVIIENNQIKDTGAVSLTGRGAVVLAAGTCTACIVRNNTVHTDSGLTLINTINNTGISGNTTFQSVVYSGTVTPNLQLGTIISVGELTGDISIANPSLTFGPAIGDSLTFIFTQDATGGRKITWGTAYKPVSWLVNSEASSVCSITYIYNGTNWIANAPGAKMECLLGSVTANLSNTDKAKTTIFTVPIGKSAIITKVIVKAPQSSLAGGTEFDFGINSACTSFAQNVDLSSMTASTQYRVVQAGSTTNYTINTAGNTFGVIPVTGATASPANATVEAWGYTY